MSELSKVESGTPEFDELVLKRYHDYPQVIKLLAEAEQEIERLKQYACQCEASVHSTQQTYAELQLEIEQLKFLNQEQRQTVDDLSRLCIRAADALEPFNEIYPQQKRSALIAELRKAAS